MRAVLSFLFCTAVIATASAQSPRLRDDNAIGWYAYTGTIALSPKWSLHTEYQWRRDEVIRSPQQSLLRIGINRTVHPALTLHTGYAWILTYPYGEYPLNTQGRTFPEHRVYEQAVVTQRIGRVDLLHRYRLEQRWIGRFLDPAAERADDFLYLNRARYMLRVQVPLQGPTLQNGEFYAGAYDEVFVGFGKNVGENVFDQNRLSAFLGFRLNPSFRFEVGYLQQIAQLGREIAGRNVFQYNNGVIASIVLNTSLRPTPNP